MPPENDFEINVLDKNRTCDGCSIIEGASWSWAWCEVQTDTAIHYFCKPCLKVWLNKQPRYLYDPFLGVS